MNIRLKLALVSCLCASSIASANTSKEYALMSVASYSGFECAALADVLKDKIETKRLFTFAYERGLMFINALQAGKVKREDVYANSPIGFSMRLQGPTADFMLGRIYESAIENALEKVFTTGDQHNSDEIQKTIAQNEFRQRNCKLLGND